MQVWRGANPQLAFRLPARGCNSDSLLQVELGLQRLLDVVRDFLEIRIVLSEISQRLLQEVVDVEEIDKCLPEGHARQCRAD